MTTNNQIKSEQNSIILKNRMKEIEKGCGKLWSYTNKEQGIYEKYLCSNKANKTGTYCLMLCDKCGKELKLLKQFQKQIKEIKTSEYIRGYSKAKKSNDELIKEIIKQERDKFQKQIKELQEEIDSLEVIEIRQDLEQEGVEYVLIDKNELDEIFKNKFG